METMVKLILMPPTGLGIKPAVVGGSRAELDMSQHPVTSSLLEGLAYGANSILSQGLMSLLTLSALWLSLVVATREFACVASCLKPCTTHHEKEDR
jgi:hypothetical protein